MYSILEQKEVEVSGVGGGVLRARRKEGPRKGNKKRSRLEERGMEGNAVGSSHKRRRSSAALSMIPGKH